MTLLGPDGFFTEVAARGLFDRAVLHFEAGRYFEAHEDWEALWHEAAGAHRDWLQGLILVAAAFHHRARGNASGFSKCLRGARGKLQGYVGDDHGLDVPALSRDLLPWFAHGERVGAGSALAAGAPPALPSIRHRAGVVPAPLPLDVVVDEGS